MVKEIHFNLKNIEHIEITPVKQLDFQWYEHAPAVKKIFGLWTKRKELEAGWCDKGGFYYSFGGRPIGRKTTERLLHGGTRFYVEENINGKQWFEKAKVYIQKRKIWYSEHFTTNEEALAWVESIKDKSGDKFEVRTKE